MNGYKSISVLTSCVMLLSSCGSNTGYVSNYPADASITTYDQVTASLDGPPQNYQGINIADISDAIPRQEPLSRYGNPTSYAVFGKRYYPMHSSDGYKERGIASWYGSKFHGRRTSSGEPYNMHAMTAAHKTLPLPTYVKVTNLHNQHKVILKVNDRGPFHENRIIDLSHTAAVKLGILGQGTALVEVEAIDPDTWGKAANPVKDAAPEKTQASYGLYVQIGAFSNAQNARKLQSSINRKLKQQASISASEKDGNTFFRVRIGPLTSAEQADTLSHHLTQQGFDTPRIVIE